LSAEEERTSPHNTNLQNWITLSEAAKILGVHFTTLRRWTNEGRVPHSRTPGGQRRFTRQDIETVMTQMYIPTADQPCNSIELLSSNDLAEQISRHAYQDVTFDRLEEIQRLRFKHGGQMLIGLLMQYTSRTDEGEVFLDEARRIAKGYGANLQEMNMSTTEATAAFLNIRQPIMDMIFTTGAYSDASDPEGCRLYERATNFLDVFLLALIESYQ
jgi:excisionase family DNA binding protein